MDTSDLCHCSLQNMYFQLCVLHDNFQTIWINLVSIGKNNYTIIKELFFIYIWEIRDKIKEKKERKQPGLKKKMKKKISD